MCHSAMCPQCHKTSYSGCGLHIEQALAGVSEQDRCSCGPAGAPVPV